MHTKEKREENKSRGEILPVPCRVCHGITRHEVLFSIDIFGEDTRWDYYYTDTYQIIKCLGCESVSFRHNHNNSEEEYVVDENSNGVPVDHEEIYPPSVVGRGQLKNLHFLPYGVSDVYFETHKALCNKQPILAGIGIRALIEAVCKEKQSAGANLKIKIDSLVTLGVLTTDGAKILHGMRMLGNEAAHQVKPHSEENLGIAMDVVENLIMSVYILPKVAEGIISNDS